MTASGASGRVPLTVRVDASLRDQAKETAEKQGISLNDLVVSAITAYCTHQATPSLIGLSPDSRIVELGPNPHEGEVLRLVELMAADMHLVREVLHAANPALEAEARTRTRSWISRLGIGGGRPRTC